MRTPGRAVILSVCCMVVLGASCALAQDWPQWRGESRDGTVAGVAQPAALPPALTTIWSVEVGEGAATPALVGDRLYVFARQGGEEVAICLSATDGIELWRNAYAEEPPDGPSGRHPGHPRSSPAVADGMMVTLGVRGVVSCLNAETGEVAWRTSPFPDSAPRFFTATSPLIIDGRAILHLGSDDGGALIAFSLANGEELWRWDGSGPAYASPMPLTIGDDTQIVTLGAEGLAGVSLDDGSLLWEIAFRQEGRAYNAATPIIEGQSVIYSGLGRGTHAVRIVAADDGFAVEELWSNTDVAVQFNTPVRVGDLLFGLSGGGNLFCLDAQTGETKWVADERLDRSGFGATVGVGFAVLALPSSGELVAFEPTDAAYTELARMPVSETPTYAHPVLSGNRLFIKNERAVTLWTIQ
ncbi:MAG: PQQ-binding-like beta-propeller repeat protein [Armatimonadota bacterium]|jgi:outer membrane protein assembly factor BamB